MARRTVAGAIKRAYDLEPEVARLGEDKLDVAEVGVTVASLGADGKVPLEQLPDSQHHKTINDMSILGDGNIAVVGDVKVNDMSILGNDYSANLTLGAGMTFSDSQVKLTTSNLSETVPKSKTLDEQDSIRLFAEEDGETKFVKASELGYARLSIAQDDSDESYARSGDFIFRRAQ